MTGQRANRELSTPQTDTAVTGRAGLMYELPFGMTPYVSYAQSFNPIFGTIFGSAGCTDGAGGLCKPMRGEQYEVGFKYRPSRDLAINGAVFDITEKNRTASNPSGAGSIQTGKVSIRGAELEAAGDGDAGARSDRCLYVSRYGGAFGRQHRQAHRDRADASGVAVGENRFSMFGIRRFLGRRRRALHRSVWDGTDTIETPGYTLYDAMLAWENRNWRFQINGTNLADKEYFTACLTRGDCFYGSRRTVLGQLTYRFGAGTSTPEVTLPGSFRPGAPTVR